MPHSFYQQTILTEPNQCELTLPPAASSRTDSRVFETLTNTILSSCTKADLVLALHKKTASCLS